MKYQVGKPGRIIVAKFEDREDVLGNLIDIAKKENLKSAVFYLIGGMREGRIVVGPEKNEIPPNCVWRELKEAHEIVGIGTIFPLEGEPKVHFHAAFGKKDMVKVGCLRSASEIYLVVEAVIMEIDGIDAAREIDPASGMALLRL